MSYLKRQPSSSSPPADCAYLVELVLKHKSGEYYTVADRLAQQLRLSPRDVLKLKVVLRRMLEGTYVTVRKSET